MGLADTTVNRVLVGVDDAPEDEAARRSRVVGGCQKLVTDSELEACEHGAFAYRMRRDLSLDRAEGDERSQSEQAQVFLKWVEAHSDASVEARGTARTLRERPPSEPRDRMAMWMSLLKALETL